jgi:hypothetical protein
MANRDTTDSYWRLWPDPLPEPPPEACIPLYHEAFKRHHDCLWNIEHFANPTSAQMLAAARALKNNGSMQSRHFAERIEAPIRLELAQLAEAE